MSERAVFLDRDGVLNRAILQDNRPYPPADVSEVEILPGVPEAMVRLDAAGFLLIVVTNQPDVGRGRTSLDAAERINRRLSESLCIDEIRMCIHSDEDRCSCRKPKPGMLLDAARKWDIDLKRSYMVGDRWRDVAAGQSAGCKTFFIDYGYAERQPDHADYRVGSLSEAVQVILNIREEA